jgi:stage V sporulation protein B
MNSNLNEQKQDFLTGALILSLAGLISQFLGVFSKIFLLWRIGEEGVGIYNFPYPFFAIILSFSSVGFNIAISKLVAEAKANNDDQRAQLVFQQGRKISIKFGLLGTLLLALLAYPMANYVHNDARALFSYLALAPTAFLTSFQATYRGYFQGLQNVKPNAYSQLIEQTFRIIIMLLLAWLLLPLGLTYAAAGATFGAAAGALAASFYLAYLYKKSTVATLQPWSGIAQEVKSLNQEIIKHALPISFAGIGLPAFLLADSLLITNRLQSAGHTLSQATTTYGMFANNAMSLITMPTILTGSLFVTLIPAIAAARAAEQTQKTRALVNKALLITLVFALPAAIGMNSVALELTNILRMSEATALVLKTLSYALPFIALQQVSSGILQGAGIRILPVVHMFFGALIKLLGNFFLIPKLGIDGAAYSTIAGFAIAALLNLYQVYKEDEQSLKSWSLILIYTISSILMGWALRLIEPLTANFISLAALIIKSLLGIIVYFALVILLNFAIKNFKKRK